MKKNVVIAVLVAAVVVLLLLNVFAARDRGRLEDRLAIALKENTELRGKTAAAEELRLELARYQDWEREKEFIEKYWEYDPPGAVTPNDPIVPLPEMGEQSITTQLEDGKEIILKFKIALIGSGAYRETFLARTAMIKEWSSDDFYRATEFSTLIAEKVVEDWTVEKIDPFPVRILLNVAVDIPYTWLRRVDDPEDMKLIEGVLLYDVAKWDPDVILPANPLIDAGRHSTTAQSKDDAEVLIEFNLTLVGYEEFREECFNRTSGEDFQNDFADRVRLAMKQLIAESTVTEITLDAIKRWIMRSIVEELNEELKKFGDPENIKFFKAILIHRLMIQSG